MIIKRLCFIWLIFSLCLTVSKGKKIGRFPSSEGCPQPAFRQNGKLSPIKFGIETYSPHETVQLKCNENYQPVNGSTKIICKETGKWNDTLATCEAMCGLLPQFPNGNWMKSSNGRSEAYFVCQQGFQLILGLDGAICIETNGEYEWEMEKPLCLENIKQNSDVGFEESVTCPHPPLRPNGVILPLKSENHKYYPGESVTLTCDVRFQPINGSSSLVCTDDGEWDDSFAMCKEITCELPKSTENGVIIELQNEPKKVVFNFGKTVTYKCNPGYSIVGIPKLYCEENGWSNKPPSCIATKCENVPLLEFGFVRPSIEPLLPGEMIEVKCNIGFRPPLGKKSFFICNEKGKWDHSSAICEEVTCEYPKLSTNVNLRLQKNEDDHDEVIKFGSKAHFSCRENYQLDGSPTRFCGVDGWSGIEAACIKRFCTKPHLPSSVNLEKGPSDFYTRDHFEVGETLVYGCPKNFKLLGSIRSQCYPDGWSGSPPFCELVGCPFPSNNDTYSVYYQKPYWKEYLNFNANVRVECQQTGYKFKNGKSPYVRCQKNGMLENFPECVEIVCKLPNPPENGKYIGITNDQEYYKVGYKLDFECYPGFYFGEFLSRKCSHNGHWTGRQIKCKERTCPRLYATNGYLSSPEPVENRIGVILYYKCHHNYRMIGSNFTECLENGSWSNHIECKEIICETLPLLKNAVYLKTEDIVHRPGAIIDFQCQDGFKSYFLCNGNGLWVDTRKNYCPQKIQCPILPSIENGIFHSLNGTFNEVGNMVDLRCNPGFKVSGARIATCLSNGSWTVIGYCQEAKDIWCRGLPHIENSYYLNDPPNVHQAHSVVYFICIEGFYSERNFIICDDNGEWTGSNLKSCKPIEDTRNQCQSINLPNIENGGWHFVNKTFSQEGDVVEILCKDGFKVSGAKYLTCLRNGSFSDKFGFCEEIFCEPLPLLANVVYINNQNTKYRPLTKILFKCKTNNFQERIVCEKNGKWDTSLLRNCEQKLNMLRRFECEDPPEILNGKLSSMNQTYNQNGDIIAVNCNDGFKLQGTKYLQCLSSGKWSGDFGFCEKIMCRSLPDLSNTQIITKLRNDPYTPGSQIAVDCSSGYVNIGKSYLECNPDGNWEYQEIQCQYEVMPCNKPDPIENGTILELENKTERFPFNSQITYECNKGFQLIGIESRICLDSGWSGEAPNCEAIQCIPPQVRRRTKNTKMYNVGAVIKIICRPGKRLIKGKIPPVLCLENGTWNDTLPKCEDITCLAPKAPKFGSIKNPKDSKKLPLNSYIIFQCDFGFVLKGIANQTCTENGWSSEKPSCIAENPRRCFEEPPIILDGEARYNKYKIYKTGDNLSIFCNPGFNLLKNVSKMFCNADGKWEKNDIRECVLDSQVINCPKPLVVANSHYEIKKTFYRPGDVLTILCNQGYRSINGSEYLFCLDDGQWDDDSPFCEVATCDPPTVPEYGSYEEIHTVGQNIVDYGFEVNYQCDPGYQIMGYKMIKCLENGWTGENPTCKKIRCDEPVVPENGWISTSSVEIGDKAIFNCFSGFLLLGPKERTCLENGQWSGEDTICDAGNSYCPEPGRPANGIKTGSTYDFGEVVTFSCNQGYTLLGSHKRVCNMGGTWTGTAPRCIEKNEFDDTGKVSLELQAAVWRIKKEQQRAERKNFNSAIYFIFDGSNSVGRKNFERSKTLAMTIIDLLEASSKTFMGALSFCSEQEKSNEDILLTTLANKTNVLNSIKNIQFKEGIIRTSLHVTLEMLEDKLIAKTKDISDKPIRAVIFLFTGGKFSVGSTNPVVTANSLFKGTNSSFFCISLTGYPQKDILYSIASMTGRFGRLFFLDNFSTLDRLNDNLKISYVQAIQKIDSKTQLKRNKSWPWTVHILYISKDRNQVFIVCAGSLLSKKWVLSAASCFHLKELPDPKRIMLKIGNDDQQRFVKRFVVHPHYQQVNSQSNALLIELETSVEFGPSVRPICLPINDAETEVDKSSNLAYFTTLKKDTEDENVISQDYIYLPLPHRNTCAKSLSQMDQTYFTDDYFCAGDGKNHPDVCGHDLGGPLILQQRNSQGETVWVQIGILSDLQLCETLTFSLYSFYLDLKKINQWIREVVK